MLADGEFSPLDWPGVVGVASVAGVAFVAWLFVLRYVAPPWGLWPPLVALAGGGVLAGVWVGRLTARASGRSALKTAATGVVNWVALFPYWFLITVYLALVVVESVALAIGLPRGVAGQYRFVGYVLVATVTPAAAFVVVLAATLAYEGARAHLGTARS